MSRRRRAPPRRLGPMEAHVFEFELTGTNNIPRHALVLVRTRTGQAAARAQAIARARELGRFPVCMTARSVPARLAPRRTPVLDKLCRQHTAFASFESLLLAAAGYRPTLRADLIGADAARLARAYDRAQARWGDLRRAFLTGTAPRWRAPAATDHPQEAPWPP